MNPYFRVPIATGAATTAFAANVSCCFSKNESLPDVSSLFRRGGVLPPAAIRKPN
jgi:hypothetical protein